VSRRARNSVLQLGAVACVIALLAALALNAHANLARLGITSGFGFLSRSTGWDVSFSLTDYSIDDPYWRVLVVGVQNTVFVGLISIVLATLIGSVLGIARTSRNLVLGVLSSIYVECFRSVPMTLQIIFWYTVMTNLPGPRSAYSVADIVFLSNRGLILPAIHIFNPLIFIGVAVGGLVTLALRSRSSPEPGGLWRHAAFGLLTLVLIVATAAIISKGAGAPLVEVPRLRGMGFTGGLHLVPEFSAVVVAIVIAGSAYVAETVRGALLAVPRGQIEAAQALGMNPIAIYLTIKGPLALRLVLPPLSNQFMMIMKATTIGIVIGFSDLFMVVAVSINHSGQTVELILIMMSAFFMINYLISTIVNAINQRIALKDYSWKVAAHD
jgi:general L-amino acid transport system permease protein